MIVVKLGGSLYSSIMLQRWVDELILLKNHTVVIVPGGGPFADCARKAAHDWPLVEEIAHSMAVLGMQQYAFMLAGLNNRIKILTSAEKLNDDRQTYVWCPYDDVAARCPYPKNWQTTSDSIALWLAELISAQKLCLIKSAPLEGKDPAQIINSDIVDAYFSCACRNYPGDIGFYHVSQITNFINDITNQ